MKQTPKIVENSALSLLADGLSLRKVAQMTGLSRGTIHRISKRKITERQVNKGGRPTLLTEVNKRYCVQQITKGMAGTAANVSKSIQDDFGITVSQETVRRALRERGLGAIEKKSKPLLSKANVKKRLEWAHAHKDWTSDDWKRVIWSDESKICQFNSDGRSWGWKRDNESLSPDHVKLTVKHGGSSIMVWGAITYAGVGWMCTIKSIMDKFLYKEILEDELEKTVELATEKLGLSRTQLIFQHDNDPKHTANIVKEYLGKQEYEVMEWPPQSPDLNPIEHVWSMLKKRLNKMETPPKGAKDLQEKVEHIWNYEIKETEVKNLIDSMPRRVAAVIKAKGYWTKY